MHEGVKVMQNETKQKKVEEATPQPQVNNDFDLKNLRLDQNFVETAGVKRLLATAPVRKPGKQDYVRVHPHPGSSFESARN
jgi:hypothetical protein